MKILVIDDDRQATRTLVGTLADHEVWVEHDAVDGLARAVRATAHGAPFDLVLCEMHMSGVSGLDVLLALRAGGEPTLCVLMSSYDRIVERPACREHVLVKPLAHSEVDELTERVHGRRTHARTRPLRVRSTMT